MDLNNVEFLMTACQNRDLEYVGRYIDAGGDVNAQDRWGHTALMIASGEGDQSIAESLVNNGANIDAQDKWGGTALMYASSNGNRNIVEFLLGHGANIDAQDQWGQTALMKRSQCGYVDIAKLLLDHGANINLCDNDGLTAFAHALRHGETLTAQYLAPLVALNPDIPYSGFPVSSFVPRLEDVSMRNYAEITKNIVPMYVNHAITDCEFGYAMQRDIEEILGGKKEGCRKALTQKDIFLMTKLVKVLRSIDYTESWDLGKRKVDKETPAIYDMEL